MARARSSPGDSRPPALAGVVIPPAVMAACVVIAASLVSSAARVPVALCGAVGTLAVAALAAEAARRGRLADDLRRRYADQDAGLRGRLAEQEAQTVRLAEVVLPEAINHLQRGDSVDEVVDALTASGELNPAFLAAHEAMLRSALDAVKAEEDLRGSAQRAFVNIARRVQAIVHQQFQDLREMEDRHGGDPRVFGDLLHLDHATALIGRLADSIAVLGGSRPGRQWQQNVPLFNVMRGAMSRITDYQRVELHSVLEVAVVGPAVEPLIHALAELLDNATRYSPPHTRVHLTAIEVQSGVAVEIEDGGVGLSEEARVRAERVLSQMTAGLDLVDLGETPRLGLSVVGRLAHANGFQVSLRPSAYAGVRAVLVIPRELVTTVPAPSAAIPGAGVVTAAARPPAPKPASKPARVPEPREEEYERNGHGLPQRHRRSATAAAANGTAANGNAAHARAEAPVPPGLWLAAFQNAVSGEPSSASPRPAGDDPSSKEGEQP
ncbi:sensor histidine kinase [Actinocrinis sp.]|uniref:sensor histidine kinase n=1 Tax=Actinocrinis sp. TaxID=1920516 RepID=UPI0032C23FA4